MVCLARTGYASFRQIWLDRSSSASRAAAQCIVRREASQLLYMARRFMKHFRSLFFFYSVNGVGLDPWGTGIGLHLVAEEVAPMADLPWS